MKEFLRRLLGASNKEEKPAPSKDTPKQFKATLIRLSGYLSAHKLALIAVMITALLGTAFMILSPKILGLAVTELFQGVMGEGIDFFRILQILLLLAALYLLSSYFTYVQEYLMVGIAQKIVYVLRKEVNEKLSRLPLNFFDSVSHGDVLSRAVNDLEKVSSTMQQSLTQLITSLITMIGVSIMMLLISPLMTLIVWVTLPLSFFITKKVVARSQNYFKGQQQALGKLNGHVAESYAGHETVKAFGREQQTVGTFNKMNQTLYESSWRAQFISSIIMPLLRFVNNIVYVAVCVVGSILVTQRTIPIGDVQAFIMYVRLFSQPITRVANISNIIQSTAAAAERVFEILDQQEESAGSRVGRSLDQPKGEVRFEDVSFRYQKDKPLLENVNFYVEQGQTVAIVGPTGAGKTTLINLLMRFYDIDSGRISIDGVDIQKLELEELRRLFGMVLQDTWLFHGTIRDNIAYGRENVSDDEVIQAARAARADHFIRTLPDGYDTVLNESASNISAGQKQLITIARAIVSNPALLLLDEATSSVDTRTEIHIQQALKRLMHGRTSFIIAHRLSTIRDADMILVMDQGQIVEQGSHEELLEKGGFYAELYESQFASEASG
ncbi:ABC transporter ATP-binding protein [Lentibacillus sediminis]|uniref:ABC transporter ATP-binding protein n=1 Tax=Lentibacillus sediminis TaxID=1940529 RepID=UPI000C1C13F4|nr:ABC transporter ATP-binding protein [Lentibacillus sediminis]